MSEPEPWNRRHNRQWFELIPELRGLPYPVQQRLYREALEHARRRSRTHWFRSLLSLAGGCVAILVAALLSLAIWQSRFNPGLMWPCIGGPLLIGTMAVVIGLDGERRLRIMRRYVWRRLLWTCSDCGYDLSGNVSGRCPECGRPHDPG